MKYTIVKKGEKTSIPLPATESSQPFWAIKLAPGDGVVVTLSEREQACGGVFLSVAILREIVRLLEEAENAL